MLQHVSVRHIQCDENRICVCLHYCAHRRVHGQTLENFMLSIRECGRGGTGPTMVALVVVVALLCWLLLYRCCCPVVLCATARKDSSTIITGAQPAMTYPPTTIHVHVVFIHKERFLHQEHSPHANRGQLRIHNASSTSASARRRPARTLQSGYPSRPIHQT